MSVFLFLAFAAGLAIGLALHGTYWPILLLIAACVAAWIVFWRRVPE